MRRLALALALAAGLAPAALALDDGPYVEIFGGYYLSGTGSHNGVNTDLGSSPALGGRFGHMFSERWGLDFSLAFAQPETELGSRVEKHVAWSLDAGMVRDFTPDRDFDTLGVLGFCYSRAAAGPESDGGIGAFAGAGLRWHPGRKRWFLRADARARLHEWEFLSEKAYYLDVEGSAAWGWAFGRL